MAHTTFDWKIGGPAGYGIKSVGAMFARALLRQGLYVFAYDEYPSLIRGGHNAYEVTVSPDPVYTTRRPVSLLVCLDQMTFDEHRHEVAEDGAAIINKGQVEASDNELPGNANVYAIPLDEIVEQQGGEKVMRNVVALGASFALLGGEFAPLKEIIEFTFEKKGKEIELNVRLAKAGYDFVKAHVQHEFAYSIKPQKNPDRMIMSGNEGIAWGAIKAGCKMYAAYPMTPASSVLHNLAAQARNYQMVVKHCEDEISAVNTAVGAGYAGIRAMTGTSGGGFSLMSETYGMAGMMEIPVVMINATRPGPSTGMPTWTGQGDLRFVLHSSQDEFPRFVLAPGDTVQCFELTQVAFDLAERYQTPVVILTDKELAESYQWVENLDTKPRALDRGAVVDAKNLTPGKLFPRYVTDVPDGVSPRPLPGMAGGEHVANSDEHNEEGFSEEGSEMRVKQMDKRFRKFAEAAKHIPQPELEGDKNADLTFVSWGSTRGAILEAMKDLRAQGMKVNFLQIKYISPLPIQKIKDVFSKAKKVAIVEGNKLGQLAGWIREHTGLTPDYKILKYDGRPFFPDEIVTTVREELK